MTWLLVFSAVCYTTCHRVTAQARAEDPDTRAQVFRNPSEAVLWGSERRPYHAPAWMMRMAIGDKSAPREEPVLWQSYKTSDGVWWLHMMS